MGLSAGPAPWCASLSERVAAFDTKAQAQLRAGSGGLLLWDWLPAPTTQCGYDTYRGDPVLGVIGQGLPAS